VNESSARAAIVQTSRHCFWISMTSTINTCMTSGRFTALMEWGPVVLPSVRDTDCVVRYGGDEFVFI